MDLLIDSDETKDPTRVFASLANGTVVVFQRTAYKNTNYANIAANNDEDFDVALEIEKNEWKESTVSCNILKFFFHN